MSLFAEDKYQKCWDAALRCLDRRSCTESEIREKLETRKFSSEEISNTIQKLQDKELIDDLDYTRRFIREYTEFKHDSIYKIRPKLIKKGISPKLIEQVWLEQNPAQILETAREIATKKLLQIKKSETDKYKIREKLMRFLGGKGYEVEIVRKVLEELS